VRVRREETTAMVNVFMMSGLKLVEMIDVDSDI
jgi:hypothetical protein